MMAHLKAALLGAAIAVSTAGSAMAIEGEEFVYTTKQTGYVSFSPSEFVPIDARSAANFRSGSQVFTSDTVDTRVCGAAPLKLPQGAVAQSIAAQYLVGGAPDASPSGLIEIYRRLTFGNTGFSQASDYEYLTLESVKSTSGSIAFYQENVTQGLGKIDNKKYLYTVRLCMDYGASVFSVQVKYNYRNAGE